MGFTNTPNMGLPVPNVGTEPGPNYAFDVNSSLTLIDSHNHNPGSGVQITPSGLNINASLPFNNNLSTNMAGVNLFPQLSSPGINTVYDSAGDLYFVDGLNRNIQITSNGSVNSGAGSINGLPSGTASASYIAINGTFVWQSATGIPANMDFGAALFRNLTNNINYVKVQPPASLGSTWTLTLPQLPSGSTKLVTLDTSGQFAAVTDVDNSTIVISSNIIKIPDGGVNTAQIADGSVTPAKLSFTPVPVTTTFSYTGATQFFPVPAGINSVTINMIGGGGGGGGAAGCGGSNDPGGIGGGGGGAGAAGSVHTPAVTPGETITINIAQGGSAGSGGGSGTGGPVTGGTNGSAGGNTTVAGSFGTFTASGANGGSAGGTSGGIGGTAAYAGSATGGNGGSPTNAGASGQLSSSFSGGSGGATSGSPHNISGGGGGGAANSSLPTGNGAVGGQGSTGATGNAGAAGTSGSGGGGGGATASTSATTGGAGGVGGNGLVTITYIQNQIGGGGSGTVTSVGIADGSSTAIFNVSGSPVTTTGTLTLALKTQAAHAVLVGPTSGTVQPTFRALVASDIPSLSSLYMLTDMTNAASVCIIPNGTVIRPNTSGNVDIGNITHSLNNLYSGYLTTSNIFPLQAGATRVIDVNNQILYSAGSLKEINFSGIWTSPNQAGVPPGFPKGMRITSGNDNTSSDYTLLTVTSSSGWGPTMFMLPQTNGTSGQVLTTDGTGITSWTASLPYTAASSPDWNGSPPTTVKDALDRIAAFLGPIP